MNQRDDDHQEANELEAATPGAQRQIDDIRERMHRVLKAMVIAGALFVIALGATAWQVSNAFTQLETERVSRIGGQSSINAYFCRKIDAVGDGVAALVAVSLRESPAPAELPPRQRQAFEDFNAYVVKQGQPPRCRQVAEQLALLTGADPEDVVITPLKLEPPGSVSPGR